MKNQISSLDRCLELDGITRDNLTPAYMAFCPCLQVAGYFHGKEITVWPEANDLVRSFGLKEKHLTHEIEISTWSGPSSESQDTFAVYLDKANRAFATRVGVKTPCDAKRVGWVSFPTDTAREVKDLVAQYVEELTLWASSCLAAG